MYISFVRIYFLQTSTCHQIHLTLHQPPHALDPHSGCLLIYCVFVSFQSLRRGRLTGAPHLDYISSDHSDNEPAEIIFLYNIKFKKERVKFNLNWFLIVHRR